MRAYLRNNQNNNFREKFLKLGEGKLHSPNANHSHVLLDNVLGHIVHSLKSLINTIYPELKIKYKETLNVFVRRQ